MLHYVKARRENSLDPKDHRQRIRQLWHDFNTKVEPGIDSFLAERGTRVRSTLVEEIVYDADSDMFDISLTVTDIMDQQWLVESQWPPEGEPVLEFQPIN